MEKSEEIEFISPLVDTTFKFLWKNKSTQNFMKRLVEKLMDIDLSKYSLYDTEINSDNGLKDYRMDIIFTKDPKNPRKSDLLNIEMYKNYAASSVLKSDSYVFKLVSDGLEQGDDYFERKVVQLNLCNGKFSENEEEKIVISEIVSRDGKYKKGFVTIYDVYLPNFKHSCYNESDELTRMLAFLNADSYDEMITIASGDKEALDIVEKLKDLSYDEQFLGLYNVERANKKLLNTERRFAKEEGITIGKAEVKYEIAKNLLNLKVDISIISKSTGLSEEEIKSLK